jgi:hypothetical protein
VPDLGPALGMSMTPPTLAVLDAIEFCREVVAKPIPRDWHKYFNHVHFGFDPQEGQEDFRGHCCVGRSQGEVDWSAWVSVR